MKLEKQDNWKLGKQKGYKNSNDINITLLMRILRQYYAIFKFVNYLYYPCRIIRY